MLLDIMSLRGIYMVACPRMSLLRLVSFHHLVVFIGLSTSGWLAVVSVGMWD